MRQLFAAFIMASAVIAGAGPASAQTATQDVTITASVPKYCQIGGVATPAALSATIPVSSAGVVTTTAIPFTVNSVVCNTGITLTASSLSGGVLSATAAPSGFTNIINYTGSATFASQTSDINTATIAAAAAAEPDLTPATTAAAATGSLSISVTPQTPSSPLVAATDYTDTLRITLVPN